MALTMLGRNIGKIGIIGSGNIGPDIALHFSQNLHQDGVSIVVVDISQTALDMGKQKTESKMNKAVEKNVFKKYSVSAAPWRAMPPIWPPSR